MVYIKINQKIESLLPKELPKSINILVIQKQKYLKYKDFKYISKKNSLELHKYVCRSDIISQIDINKIIELSKRTPQQKRLIQQLKNKHQYRMMNTTVGGKPMNMSPQTYYYGNAGQDLGGNNIKQLTDSVSFGITFLFSFFMAGVTGYFFAQYFFHFQLTGCLMVSVVFIFATIFVQTWLYMIKQSKVNRKIEQQRKEWEKKQSFRAENNLKKNNGYKTQLNSRGKLKKE